MNAAVRTEPSGPYSPEYLEVRSSRKLITVGSLRNYVALIYPADGPMLSPRLFSHWLMVRVPAASGL
jgi:hypothetical protein